MAHVEGSGTADPTANRPRSRLTRWLRPGSAKDFGNFCFPSVERGLGSSVGVGACCSSTFALWTGVSLPIRLKARPMKATATKRPPAIISQKPGSDNITFSCFAGAPLGGHSDRRYDSFDIRAVSAKIIAQIKAGVPRFDTGQYQRPAAP
jgi:hypothetical protein